MSKKKLGRITIGIYEEDDQLRFEYDVHGIEKSGKLEFRSHFDNGESDEIVQDGIPGETEWLIKELLYLISSTDFKSMVESQSFQNRVRY